MGNLDRTPYQEGIDAFSDWMDSLETQSPDNPYQEGSEAFSLWDRGFDHESSQRLFRL